MALQLIMADSPVVNVCVGVSSMNVAKDVTWIKTIHYMCNNCGIFLQWLREDICLFGQPSVLQYRVLHPLASRLCVVVRTLTFRKCGLAWLWPRHYYVSRECCFPTVFLQVSPQVPRFSGFSLSPEFLWFVVIWRFQCALLNPLRRKL